MAYFDGDHWTPITFYAWAAGFVDRSGRIDVRAASGRVRFAVSARDREVLHGLRDAFGAGEIEIHPRIADLFVWRVNDGEDVRRILTDIQPFLTTNGDAARKALANLDAAIACRVARAQQDRDIMARVLDGQRKADIARALGLTDAAVRQAIERWQREHGRLVEPRTRAVAARVKP